MRHKKIFFFYIIFTFSFLFFVSNANAIVNENDINFTWSDAIIFNMDNPRDIQVDNSTLSLTSYNDTDYFEHVLPFDSKYYNNTYLSNENYTLGNEQNALKSIVNFNDYFYCFDEDTSLNVIVYDKFLNYISNFTNPLSSYIDECYAVDTDNNYLYVFGGKTPNYKLLVLDFNFTYIKTLFSLYAYYSDMCYGNGKIYIGVILTVTGLNVYEYDLEGNLLDSKYLGFTQFDYTTIDYYENNFYIHSRIDELVYVYDNDFNEIGNYSFSSICDPSNIYIYNDLVYCFLIGIEDDLQVLNMTFEEEESYYFVVDNYPNDFGLFDTVNNLNVSLSLETNPLGNYIGNYSFENDTIGGNPLNWEINEYTGNIDVIDNFNYHSKVVKCFDNGGSRVELKHTFDDPQEFGTFEFWYSANSYTKSVQWQFFGSVGVMMYLGTDNGYLQYFDGIWNNIIGLTINVWYHVRIDFEATSGNYNGLPQYNYDVYVNSVLEGSELPFSENETFFLKPVFTSANTDNDYSFYIDAVGFSWTNYNISDNLEYGIESNGFYNELVFLNEEYDEIVSIECKNGSYYVNEINIDYNIFFNNSQYIYDFWSLKIELDQLINNCTIYFYNQSSSLLYNETFSSNSIGNAKYVKYIQYYQNSSHFVNISNFYIYSNDTLITGKNGFLSYYLDLIDVDTWEFSVNSLLNISGNGIYRFYVSNDSYGNEFSEIYQISNWIEIRDEEISIDLSYFDYIITNPYLIVETMNGLYLFDKIVITSILGDIYIIGNRMNFYYGTITFNNIDESNSYFYTYENKLFFKIIFDDNNLEYMKISFDIENIVNLNYQLIYNSYLNTSNDLLINQMNLVNNDASQLTIDLEYLYNSDIETLEQDKITNKIEFYISDNDLISDNTSIFGYIGAFTFNYSEQINISIFVENMLIMLIPLLVILALTFSISYVFRDKNSKEVMSKRLFFPIFMISSFLTFIIGFFDFWILFIMIVSALIYIINKKEEYL